MERDGDTPLASEPERNTVYSSHPNAKNEENLDVVVVLSPLASTPSSSSNTMVAADLIGLLSHRLKAATGSLRVGLLPRQDRAFNDDGLGLPLVAASTSAGSAGGSRGASSAMGLSISNPLHQRTSSLHVSDGRTDSDGRGRDIGGRGETASETDGLPPYPGTAW